MHVPIGQHSRIEGRSDDNDNPDREKEIDQQKGDRICEHISHHKFTAQHMVAQYQPRKDKKPVYIIKQIHFCGDELPVVLQHHDPCIFSNQIYGQVQTRSYKSNEHGHQYHQHKREIIGLLIPEDIKHIIEGYVEQGDIGQYKPSGEPQHMQQFPIVHVRSFQPDEGVFQVLGKQQFSQNTGKLKQVILLVLRRFDGLDIEEAEENPGKCGPKQAHNITDRDECGECTNQQLYIIKLGGTVKIIEEKPDIILKIVNQTSRCSKGYQNEQQINQKVCLSDILAEDLFDVSFCSYLHCSAS